MKIFDLHNDFLTESNNPKKTLKSFPKNVYPVAVIYRGENNFNYALEKIEIFNKIKYFKPKFAFEDIGYKDLNLDTLLSVNPLYVSLTYNGENAFGYGVDFDYPLKKQGVEIAKKISKNGVIIDTAHLSKRGTLSLIDNGIKIINSHTCFNAVYKHKRNIDAAIIKGIISTGGLVGFTLVGHFISKDATLYDAFKHLDYFIQKFGYKNLCLGTDFYGTDFLVKGIKNYKNLYKLSNILKSYRYTTNVIDAIFYDNAYNFFKNKL